jgi:hypothetical protein
MPLRPAADQEQDRLLIAVSRQLSKGVHQRPQIMMRMETAGKQNDLPIHRQGEIRPHTSSIARRKMRSVRTEFLDMHPLPRDAVVRHSRLGIADRVRKDAHGRPKQTPLIPLGSTQLTTRSTAVPQIIKHPTIHFGEQRETQPPHERWQERMSRHLAHVEQIKASMAMKPP